MTKPTDSTGPWNKNATQSDLKKQGENCDYTDGETALRHDVWVKLSPDARHLRFTFPQDDDAPRLMAWDVDDVRFVEGQSHMEQGRRDMIALFNINRAYARLYVTDDDLINAIKKSCPKLKKRAPMRGKGKITALVAGAIASVGVIIFGFIPLIASILAALLPIEGEAALGDKTYDQVREAFSRGFYPVEECTDPAGLVALGKMRDRLQDAAEDLQPIQVSVLDLDMANAFALPGGRVVFTRGMLETAEHPDEIAAVFSHEMGHVAHRDPTRHTLRSIGTFGVLSLVLGDFAGGTVILLGATQLVNAQYSQGAESSADAYGQNILPLAGVSPGAVAPLFDRLRDEHGDAEGFAAHLSSHPKLGDRVEIAIAAGEGYAQTQAPILNDSEWGELQGICASNDKYSNLSRIFGEQNKNFKKQKK